jgi:DNA-damage-inducible protein J
MAKTEFIRARMEPEIKVKAEDIFNKIGISPSTAIQLFYKKVIEESNINFLLEVPKKKK